MNLYEKISAISDEVQYIQKDGRISFGSTSYKAVTEAKVTSIIKPKLCKHKVLIVPVDIDERRDGNITTLRTTYKVINAENPDEWFTAVSVGQGSDTQDKGANKASTASWKYLVLRLFNIPSGEDPDAISSDELDAKYAAETPVISRKLLNAQILALGGNDLPRINTFINKMFKTDGETLDSISDEKAQMVKVAMAQAAKRGT